MSDRNQTPPIKSKNDGRRQLLHQIQALISVPAINTVSALGLATSVSQSAAQSVLPSSSGNQPREVLGVGKPQVAIMLPPGSSSLGFASQAVRAGIVAAHRRDGGQKPLLIVEVEEQGADLFAMVNQLRGEGADWIAGPLTRTAVNTLIDVGAGVGQFLSLSYPDPDRHTPQGMLAFGLSAEPEGRQIAQTAYDDVANEIPNRRPLTALALTMGNASFRRAAASFVDTWRALGGEVPLPLEVENRQPGEVRAAIDGQKPDVVFLAISHEMLRNLRSQLQSLRLYSTTQLSPFNAPGQLLPARSITDFEGLKFLEMPWISAPESPIGLAYPKAPAPFTSEMHRLYALGLDCYRLLFDVLPFPERRALEGATGRLVVQHDLNRIDRLSQVLRVQGGAIVAVGQ